MADSTVDHLDVKRVVSMVEKMASKKVGRKVWRSVGLMVDQ